MVAVLERLPCDTTMTCPTPSSNLTCSAPMAMPSRPRGVRRARSTRLGLCAGLLSLASGLLHAQSMPGDPSSSYVGQGLGTVSGWRPHLGLDPLQIAGTTPGADGRPGQAGGATVAGEEPARDSRTDPAVGADDAVPTELRNPGQGKSTLWYVQTSLYTRHFHPDPAHQNHQRLIDIEYWRDDGWLAGFAAFKNSFGQPTQYLFVGKRWRPFDSVPRAYLRVAGGLLHGYKGEYRDKVPFNSRGVAPVILPGIGYSGRRFGSELIFFGANGVMLTVGAYLY